MARDEWTWNEDGDYWELEQTATVEDVLFSYNADPVAQELMWQGIMDPDHDFSELIEYLRDQYDIDIDNFDWEDFRDWYETA